jgi:hypothetical protein
LCNSGPVTHLIAALSAYYSNDLVFICNHPQFASVVAEDAPSCASERDAQGRTLLFFAQSAEQADAICTTTNIDMHAADLYGCTALHVASMNGKAALVCSLLSHGSRATDTDAVANTPLHRASMYYCYLSLFLWILSRRRL